MNDSSNKSVYRVIQLGVPKGHNELQTNEPVTDFDDLVTHHPRSNHGARMREGIIVGGEQGRAHAFISGEVQEIEIARNGKTYGLEPDQILLKKDFILEHPAHPPMSRTARAVDVPSPSAGWVGRVSEQEGLVDILDRQGGKVVARVRHMHPIAVTEGQEIEYGQALGTQGRQQTGAIHVHMEMDTRYYRQFENYVNDLVSGRLSTEAEHRVGIEARPAIDDGVFRLGESGERVAAVQRALAADDYRAVADRPIAIDGVYRPDIQGALLAFQQDHRIPQTGDIDLATWQVALRVNLDKPLEPAQWRQDSPAPIVSRDGVFRSLHDIERGLDPHYTPLPGQRASDSRSPADPARSGRTPDYHGHPDHNPGTPILSAPHLVLPTHSGPDDPAHPDHALLQQIRDHVRGLDRAHGREFDQHSEQLSHSLLTLAKDKGLSQADHVVLSVQTAGLKSGENVFVVQGRMDDPTQLRAWTKTEAAMQVPVEESDRQLQVVNERLAQEQTQAQRLAQQPAAQNSHVMRM